MFHSLNCSYWHCYSQAVIYPLTHLSACNTTMIYWLNLDHIPHLNYYYYCCWLLQYYSQRTIAPAIFWFTIDLISSSNLSPSYLPFSLANWIDHYLDLACFRCHWESCCLVKPSSWYWYSYRSTHLRVRFLVLLQRTCRQCSSLEVRTFAAKWDHHSG